MAAQSPSASHKTLATPGGWPLLRGRLRPPTTRSALVDRPRLNALLNQAGNFEVALVSAPAGYGKTTAVAQWFASLSTAEAAAAWVSLDEMDSEPSRILMYLVASLSASDESLATSFSGLFQIDFEASVAFATRSLLAVLESYEHRIYLVVDDLHGNLEEAALDIFSKLVNHGLPNLHLVLILRDAIALPLARARMRRSVLEVGPRELQFTEQEAVSYFGIQDGLEIDCADVKALCHRTDGWIAGLQLAVLSLRGHRDPRAFIDSFSGQHRDVGDLLTEEVLGRLPPDTVDFLEQTAVLSSFSAPLCNELLGRDDAATVIQRLEDGNFFIFPMDDERAYYRYHRLFAEHLRRNLEQKNPNRIVEIHRIAANWFRDHGLPLRACLHAGKTGDMPFLAAVLEQVALNLRELGYGGTLVHYGAILPDDIANLHPRMQLERVYALTLSWRFDEARGLLDQVRNSLTRKDGVADEIYPVLVHRESQLALLTDDHENAERLCREWLEIEPASQPFDEAVARTSIICSQAERYEFGGLELAADIRQAFERDGMKWATVWNDSIFGACYFSRGNLGRAEMLYRRALDTACNLIGRLSATPSMPGLYLAELLYERGNLAEARHLVDDYLELAAEMGMLGQLAAGFITKARLLRLHDNSEAALRVLDEGDTIATRRRFDRLHHLLMLERYQMLLEQGNVEKCFRIARADGLMSSYDKLAPGAGATSRLEPQALSWAAIGLARNKVAEASDLIDRWRKFTVARGAYRSAIRFYVLGIRAAIIRGDRPHATRLLREVLGWSAEHGFVRSIIDGGTPVLDLLQALDIKDEKLAKTRQALLRSAGLTPADTRSQLDGATVVEALNARETEILRLAEQGLMNKQIASDLGLTEGTVKWYMQQIFAKLGVKRRAQAIHRAKHLGFLR